MSQTPTIKRGRTFALPIHRRAADTTTPVDWPVGTITSQLRAKVGGDILATFTVDDTKRLAADGGTVVLELTDEETELVRNSPHAVADVRYDDNGRVRDAVPVFRILITDVATGRPE